MRSPNLVHLAALVAAHSIIACGGSGPDPFAAGGAGSGGGGAFGAAGGGAGLAGGAGGEGGEGGSPPECPTDVAPRPGTVITDRGAVTGAPAGATWSYKAIPYAAPPVGALRWRPPEPAACWEGALQATEWGPACPQLSGNGTGAALGSEDCLTLNVWTPTEPAAEPAPVMVWLHGGGHQAGSAGEQVLGVRIYDGQRISERTGAVVVTVNYRLGALGWLAHPSLTDESEPKSSGMYGHLDQVAALRWVQSNAAAFGGDPKRVLVFGESAGGVSVCSLVASPLAAGLFSAAVVQSGACVAKPLADAEDFGEEVFAAAGCGAEADPLGCMRALPAAEVIEALPVPVNVSGKGTSAYGSIVDGHALTGTPHDVIQAGEHNAVPIVFGANSDETSKAVPLPLGATEAQYAAAVQAMVGALAPLVLQQYPASDYPSPWAAYVALTSDAKFICTARRAARAALVGQGEGVYRYFFTHALDNAPEQTVYGAWHGVDVLYVFDHLELGNYVPSAAEEALSDSMIDYWYRLAASGDPNGAGATEWPAYDDADTYLQLEDPLTAGTGVRTAQCDFWDSLVLEP